MDLLGEHAAKVRVEPVEAADSAVGVAFAKVLLHEPRRADEHVFADDGLAVHHVLALDRADVGRVEHTRVEDEEAGRVEEEALQA